MSSLFIDNDAIDKDITARMKGTQMFVLACETEATTDVNACQEDGTVPVAIYFDGNARMLSVVIHDNLDGNHAPCSIIGTY